MADFEAGDYTGPVGPSREDREKWYHRFKDFCYVLMHRNFGIVANPAEKGLVKDSLERMQEDESWTYGKEVPPVFFTSRVKRGEIRPVDPATMKELTMAAVVQSQRGFGRFSGLWTPGRDGLSNPWRVNGKTQPHVKPPRTDEQVYNAE